MNNFNPDFLFKVSLVLESVLAMSLMVFSHASYAIRHRRVVRQKEPKQAQLDLQYWSIVTSLLILLVLLLISKL